MELRDWEKDVNELLNRVEERRAALRTHGPDHVVAPLRDALERLAGTLSFAVDDLRERAEAVEAQTRGETTPNVPAKAA
ncbi:MAG TPA: hypothetical protein VIK91_14460 [Nannocystis sp.]